MDILKWKVDAWLGKPEVAKYVKQTAHFYIKASGGRDSIVCRYYSYFDSEADALAFIEDKKAKRLHAKNVGRIKSHGVELLEALELAEETLAWAAEPYQENTDLQRSAAHRLIKVRAAIAKAKGEV